MTVVQRLRLEQWRVQAVAHVDRLALAGADAARMAVGCDLSGVWGYIVEEEDEAVLAPDALRLKQRLLRAVARITGKKVYQCAS